MNEQSRLESATTHNTLNTSRAIIALKMQLYYLKGLSFTQEWWHTCLSILTFSDYYYFNKSQNFSDNVTYWIMEMCVEDLKTQIVNFFFFFLHCTFINSAGSVLILNTGSQFVSSGSQFAIWNFIHFYIISTAIKKHHVYVCSPLYTPV